MEAQLTLSPAEYLRLLSLDKANFNNRSQKKPATPNEWFAQLYPQHFKTYGSAFIELTQPFDRFTSQILPISINTDFFAAILGGRKDLGHHVVYFEPEMQFYFKDADGVYKTTTQEKLATQYRALMIKCAQEMPGPVHKLNLFREFRSDGVAKAVVQRAKSILAADHTFFSATSKHQRINGPELYERVARVFIESMLEQREGSILTVTQAHNLFCKLTEERNLTDLKRGSFKNMMQDLIKDKYGMSLRNDVPDELNKQQQAWKGLRLLETQTLVA